MNYQKIISGFHKSLEEGLKYLFEEYGSQLLGFSVTHFHIDEDEGYDVLYKTLEIVGKVINRYEFSSENHFTNWLFKIHKNNVLQLLRRKKAKSSSFMVVNYNDWENEIKDLDDKELIIDFESHKQLLNKISNINPYSESAEANKLMLSLEKALLQLNDLERELLLLRMSDYSYDEIAAMLGIENNQLKVKFNRAKAKLEKKTLEILNNIYNETR